MKSMRALHYFSMIADQHLHGSLPLKRLADEAPDAVAEELQVQPFCSYSSDYPAMSEMRTQGVSVDQHSAEVAAF
jgi:hypothetical protein